MYSNTTLRNPPLIPQRTDFDHSGSEMAEKKFVYCIVQAFPPCDSYLAPEHADALTVEFLTAVLHFTITLHQKINRRRTQLQ